MNKIYCKNCKYFIPKTRDGYGYLNKDFPECKLTAKKVSKFNKVIIEYGIIGPDTKNQKNDCKDYKRKWWKFWVRK